MAWLDTHPPVRGQWYERRNRPLTGCTVLHTSESVMDTVGPDTGAEAVADFIRRRTTPGSYHDLCDSDSALHLVDYVHGAFHDGTGSNNWALSISFACRTTDWARMRPEKRRAFLRQGAAAFARQQAWRKANGHQLTELRLITKAQSDAGASGFIYHGHRDPGRRTDPGVAEPNLFPFGEFITECALALGILEEDDMPDINEISVAVRDWSPTAVTAPTIDWGTHKTSVAQQTADNAKAIAALSGQIAGLTAAIQGLAAGTVDMAAIRAESRKGTEEALARFEATVTIANPNPA